MSTLKGERVLCLKEANAQAAPNTRQTTHLTRYLRHTTLTGTLALHSAVRTLNPPPARSQHRLNKYVGKTGSSALFQALMPRMSQLSVIKSPPLLAGCTSALSGGMLRLLFQLLLSTPQSPSLGFLRLLAGFNCWGHLLEQSVHGWRRCTKPLIGLIGGLDIDAVGPSSLHRLC